MSRGRGGLALLLVIVALAVLDAVLAALWLWSRAEAQDAVESLAVSRAEWAATAALTQAVDWLGRRDSLTADTLLIQGADAPEVAWQASLRRLTPDLAAVRAEGRVPASGAVLVARQRCLWLELGAPDSAGLRRFRRLPAERAAPCW